MSVRIRIRRLLCAAVCLLLFLSSAQAGILSLPASLTEIEEEAFAGMTSVTDVSLRSGVTAIGESAFSGCTSLRTVSIPASVTSIAESAFSGCPEDLLVYTLPSAYAAQYARAHKMDYDMGGVCRALVIGQNYTGSASYPSLEAPARDAAAFSALLQMWGRTLGVTTTAVDLTGAEILASISSCFAGATDADISIFYYAGHGAVRGGESLLVGTGGTGDFISASDLYAAFASVAGRVVLIIDACHAGGMLQSRGADTGEADPAAFVQGFLSPFRENTHSALRTRSGQPADRFFVMASSAIDEDSFEAPFSSPQGTIYTGVFTHFLMLGCGYNSIYGTAAAWAADSNGNGVITFPEAFRYARDQTLAYVSGYGTVQNAQVWPTDAEWFGLFRY